MNHKDNTICYRRVNDHDVDELYELLNGLTLGEKFFFHPHPFDRLTIQEICTSKNDNYFVMILDGKIIGYSMLRLFGYKIPSFGCCIRKGYSGKGYGSMLTVWTVDQAKKLGYSKIILKVHKDNLSAFKIYTKIGFSITGEIPEKDEITMEKQLI